MNKGKKIIWLAGGIAVLVAIALVCLRLFAGGPEDTWIKNSRGIYVEHGAPAETPSEVTEQQQAIDCANEVYKKAKELAVLDSQCLGTCVGYAIDIVHVPRIASDNLAENQCADYKDGKVSHFIELDKDGNVVRVE
jgi:hypothetical protein